MRIKYLLTTLTCLFLLSVSVFAQRLNYDTSFTPTINGSVNLVEILSDGKIMIAGDFTTVNGVSRIKIARLNANGSLDTVFDANATTVVNGGAGTAAIFSMEVLNDGKLLLAGYFGSGQPLEYNRSVVRLNTNGSLDGTLTSIPQIHGGGFVSVTKAEQLPNGKILICGNFTLPNGNAQPKIARYNFDGTYDSTFTTAINHDCRDVEGQPDGKYLVSGFYTTVNGNPSPSLVRFNADDSVDTSFNAQPIPNTSDQTYYKHIELESDGKIIAFRGFSVYERVTRLNPDGSIYQSFPTNIDEPGDVAVQLNGKVIVVADYSTGNEFGQSDHLNRFNTDGTHDPSSNRFGFAFDNPRAVAVAADGRVIVGGPFTAFGYTPYLQAVSQPYLARLVPEAIPIKPKFDFDGDGKDDVGVYRPSDTYWYLNRSTAGFFAAQFGLPQDKPIAADYDGDGKADIAIFRDGAWMWLRSSDSTFTTRICGQAVDIPLPNYNDGTADFLVFRPSDGKFYIQRPHQNVTPADMRNLNPLPTDKPVVADYDGDGTDDLAVFRDGQWRVLTSNNLSLRQYNFGLAGDIPVPADYDGDGRADYAVFRPSDGNWYIQRSAEGFYAANWGLANDLLVPADYDGDGKTDIAVYRNGVWYQLRSTNTYHFEQFGLSNDIPIQLR